MTVRLMTGSRYWPDSEWALVWEDCHAARVLIVGDCPTGVDLWVRRFAQFYQRDVEVHRADWDRHGKRAGPIRNGEMVRRRPDDCRGYLIHGFGSPGTRDCLRQARGARIPTRETTLR